MKRKMFLVTVLIIMWVSALLEYTNLPKNSVAVAEIDKSLTITINVLPRNEQLSKEINGRNIIGYAMTKDYTTVRETPISTGRIVRQLSPGNNIYIVGVENDWYEVYSKSGNTHGFVIEDVLDVIEMNGLPSQHPN